MNSNEETTQKLLSEYLEQQDEGLVANMTALCPNDPGAADELRAIMSIEQDLKSLDCRPEPSSPPEIPGLEIHERIGGGSQGEVWRATHRQHGVVAVKVYHTRDSSGFQKRMEKLTRLPEHRHIDTILEFGPCDWGWYVLRRFRPNGSLRDRMQGTPMHFERAAQVLLEVLNGLSAAHAKGIWHRDLKPDNILFDRKGRAIVADFDACATDDDLLSGWYGNTGTMQYMAPEQLSGKPRAIGPEADFFAAGLILYEMLTGHPPFSGGTRDERLKDVSEHNPRSPDLYNPDIPHSFGALCLKAISRSPSERFRTARTFSDAVRTSLKHSPRARRLRRATVLLIVTTLGNAISTAVVWYQLRAQGRSYVDEVLRLLLVHVLGRH